MARTSCTTLTLGSAAGTTGDRDGDMDDEFREPVAVTTSRSFLDMLLDMLLRHVLPARVEEDLAQRSADGAGKAQTTRRIKEDQDVLARAHRAMHGRCARPLVNGEDLSVLNPGNGLIHAKTQLDRRGRARGRRGRRPQSGLSEFARYWRAPCPQISSRRGVKAVSTADRERARR